MMLTPAAILDRSHSFPGLARSGLSVGRGSAQGPAGIPMSYARNAEIYGEGENAGCVYRVLSGAVRISKLLPDGRRQISAFHMAGDMFGFEPGDERNFSAEAIVPTKVLVYRSQSLVSPGAKSESFLRELLSATTRELRHTQNQLLLMGRKNALERVAHFLLEMADRAGKKTMLELAMPRHDIADYLGLTLETVSRMFAELKEIGAIRLHGARRVELLDRERLAAMAA